jgi:hypothetical protein
MVVQEVGTGINAHFRFARVTPGRYIVWSDLGLGEDTYIWWVPVDLRSGITLQQDLDNAEELTSQACGPPGH